MFGNSKKVRLTDKEIEALICAVYTQMDSIVKIHKITEMKRQIIVLKSALRKLETAK